MWPGRDEIAGLGLGGDGGANGAGAVGGGDAGGDAVGGLDGDGEGRLERRGVVDHHQRQLELADPLLGQREADEPAALTGHEVDGLRSHLLGRHHEVALVLAVAVIGDDDHLALLDLSDGLLDQRDASLLGAWHACPSWPDRGPGASPPTGRVREAR